VAQYKREAIALAKDRYGDDVAAVFPGGHDETHGIRPDSVTYTMRDIIATLGLKNASPHDLRRTGATNMVSERLRFAPFIVSQVLGHSSDTGGAAAVTLAHYALYNYAKEKREALEAWEKLLFEIVGEKNRPLQLRRAATTAAATGRFADGSQATLPPPNYDPVFRAQVVREVDHLVEDHGAESSLVELAERAQRSLDSPGAASLDPSEQALWRSVVVELRRRSIRAV
jgi:hypothetical protein